MYTLRDRSGRYYVTGGAAVDLELQGGGGGVLFTSMAPMIFDNALLSATSRTSPELLSSSSASSWLTCLALL